MIKPVLTACTLTCDNCNHEFNLDKRHVFKTPSQALVRAEQYGWNVNLQDGHAACPECRTMPPPKHGAEEVGEANSSVSPPAPGLPAWQQGTIPARPAKKLKTGYTDCYLL